MGKTYKVECTEEETQYLGGRRWIRENQRYYFWRVLCGAIVMLGFLLGSALGLTVWASAPGFFISAGACIFLGVRMQALGNRAGKIFVQSLKAK